MLPTLKSDFIINYHTIIFRLVLIRDKPRVTSQHWAEQSPPLLEGSASPGSGRSQHCCFRAATLGLRAWLREACETQQERNGTKIWVMGDLSSLLALPLTQSMICLYYFAIPAFPVAFLFSKFLGLNIVSGCVCTTSGTLGPC